MPSLPVVAGLLWPLLRSYRCRPLWRLPVLQRTVMAFEIDGATPAQTAEALGVPSANVRQNLRRARHSLERILQEQDEGGAL
ncbi:RNA polymerase sigma factor [Streptomyces inhibens]|uniref:RNA polymerase sigma factor n=1 Tax=Streptomyces inhibens TaxID=2293571 RepID=UPI0036BDC1DF